MSKNILVTGGDGFIGGHLVAHLKTCGYNIFVFDINQGNISYDDLNIAHSESDYIDHVIHLAARTFVPESWEESFSYYQTNFMGTINTLEYSKKNKCPMTYINTYVYGEPQYLPIDEKHESAPNTPYNHSKVLAEDACRFYSQHMGLDVTVLRVFNIFGPGQDIKFLIPGIIADVLDPGTDIIEVNNLKPKRDYVYIEDLVEAIKCTINRTEGFNIYNIGSGKSYSVQEIIKLTQSIVKTKKQVVSKNQIRKNEIMDVRADISKAERELGFHPKFSLEEGLEKMIKYKNT